MDEGQPDCILVDLNNNNNNKYYYYIHSIKYIDYQPSSNTFCMLFVWRYYYYFYFLC